MAREAVNVLTHLLWLVVAIPATLALWQHCRGNRPRQLAMLVYGLGLVLCAAGSTAYHLSGALHDEDLVSAEAVRVFEMLDHMGIYLLIAGTTTPIVFTLLPSPARERFLMAVWVAAMLGIVARGLESNLPKQVHVILYLGLGWGLGATAPGLARVLPLRDLRLIWLGGLFYTIGAVAHAMTWPMLWPNVLGPHQLLHLFVLAGSATHFIFIWRHVVPFHDTVEVTPLMARPRMAQAISSS